MSLRALLFDVDGTVADTERYGHRPAYNRAFRKMGLGFRWGPGLYRKLLAQPGGKERVHHYIEQYRPELGEHADAHATDPQQFVEQIHELKSYYFRRCLRRGQVPLRPGIARLIREADAAGVHVALVSNASRASLRPVLRYGLGDELAARIDLVVGGDDVKRKKPHPDTYLLALRKLGLAPGDCIAIEDSAMGLRAAVAAGVPTIITTNANTVGEDFSAALMVVDSLGEADRPARSAGGAPSPGVVTLAHLQGFTSLGRANAA